MSNKYKALPKNVLEEIRKENPIRCNITWAGLETSETGTCVRLECNFDDAGNFLSSTDLAALLSLLQMHDVVKSGRRAMWVGFNNYEPQTSAKFKMWAQI